MAEDVTIPKVGKVPKRVLFPILAGAGGFLIWRYYKSRKAIGSGDETADGGYEDPGVLPSVAGAVKADNSYGSGSAAASTDDFGFNGKTNDEWSQYVGVQLSQSDKWSYGDIVTALGNYLTGIPLTTAQQEIVRAGVAVAGYPPVGAHPIVGGGNVPITIAPTGVRVTATATTITVSFSPVAGASRYNAYRSNASSAVGTANSSPITLTGLTPGTTYSVQVAAVSASGIVGPKSSAVSIKTPAVNLPRPVKPTVTAITASSAHFTTKPVAYATSYQWYVQSILRGTTDSPAWTATKMKPRTKYRVQVRADTATGAPSGLSDSAYFTTTR